MGFGFRPLTRDDLLGTLITISGVICFNQFSGGPRRPPPESEFEVFITSKRTILCIAILQGIFLASMVVILAERGRGRTSSLMFALGVTCVSGCCSAFMDVACKGWSAVLSGGIDHAWVSWRFWAALAVNVLYLVGMRVSMIYGCKRCDVLLFVPLHTVLNIFFSVLVGMVILRESEGVESWVGLVAASTSVLGGVVMTPRRTTRKHRTRRCWLAQTAARIPHQAARQIASSHHCVADLNVPTQRVGRVNLSR